MGGHPLSLPPFGIRSATHELTQLPHLEGKFAATSRELIDEFLCSQRTRSDILKIVTNVTTFYIDQDGRKLLHVVVNENFNHPLESMRPSRRSGRM
jgi:hypothetical protein